MTIKELTRVAEYEYLGVMLDESLSRKLVRIGIRGHTRRNINMHTATVIFTNHLFILLLITSITVDVRMLII